MYEKCSRYRYGSLEEAMMLQALNRKRNQQLLEVTSNVVDPDKATQLMRQYQGLLFPEQRYNDLKKISDSRKLFEKLRAFDFTMKPI